MSVCEKCWSAGGGTLDGYIAEMGKHASSHSGQDVIDLLQAKLDKRQDVIDMLHAELIKHGTIARAGWNVAMRVQALYDDGFLEDDAYAGVFEDANVYLAKYRKLGEQE